LKIRKDGYEQEAEQIIKKYGRVYDMKGREKTTPEDDKIR